MSATPVPGVQGYNAEAPELLKIYERVRFEDAHSAVLRFIPPAPCEILDVGAGTGRDAAWFAARGDRVTAVEPTCEMRQGAMALHPAANIDWIDDHLPMLSSMRGRTFDLVWVSAVWMHLDDRERTAAMANVAALVRSGGALMISLRHGPVPEGRRMFDVRDEQTTTLAVCQGLSLAYAGMHDSAYAPGVTWSRLWFVRAGERPQARAVLAAFSPS